jgi:hypothetical protein
VQIIFVTLPILLLLSGAVLISDAFFLYFSGHSAADEFREQFTQLDENGSRSGLLAPVQRKHASLPR